MDTMNITDLTLSQAVTSYKNGDIDKAQSQFLNLLNIDPKNLDALYFMSMIDHSSGRAEVAEYRANELLLQKPTDGKALNLLGTILMSQGKTSEALAHFEKGIKYNKEDPVLRVNAAICNIGEGKPEASIALCKEAISLNADYPNAYNILGNAYMGQSDMENAAKSFKKALEKKPDFHDARFNLGVALFDSNKIDDALECFDAVLAHAPANVNALTRKADVYSIQNKLEEAGKLYQQAISTNNNFSPAYIGMGKLFEKLKKHDEALSHFKRAIELNPNNIEALTFTGVAFQKLGQIEAAAAAFSDVIAIDPDNAQAKFLLATVQDTAPPAKPDGDYVKRLFDEFADTFDNSLSDVEYNAPEQLITLAKQFLSDDNTKQNIIDIGCGTGLNGLQFKSIAKTLKGIDISPRMLSIAKARDIYDKLEENEILTALVRHQKDTDIIVSADTFPYLGDLESVFLSVASALRDNGMFLFTVETHNGEEDYLLGQTARYSHSQQYINDLAKRRGFKVLACKNTVYRKESGNDVNGLIVALGKN